MNSEESFLRWVWLQVKNKDEKLKEKGKENRAVRKCERVLWKRKLNKDSDPAVLLLSLMKGIKNMCPHKTQLRGPQNFLRLDLSGKEPSALTEKGP